MQHSRFERLPADLKHLVQVRTGWRIHGLTIDLESEHVILRGRATTWFARQLAQHTVHDWLPPHVRLENSIEVHHVEEFLPGVPFN